VLRCYQYNVDVLQGFGINVADIKKLREAGICTVEALQMSCKKDVLSMLDDLVVCLLWN
jgi:hypothetical protein